MSQNKEGSVIHIRTDWWIWGHKPGLLCFCCTFPRCGHWEAFRWLLCPRSAPWLCACVYSFSEHALAFWHCKSQSGAGISHFTKEPWFLLLGEEVRNEASGTRCSLLLGNRSFWGLQITEQGDTCVHSYPWVHTHTSVKVSACNRVYLC